MRLFSKSEVLKEAIKSAEVTVESSEGIFFYTTSFFDQLLRRIDLKELCTILARSGPFYRLL